jgi:subtilisin-like proprotein convertase family protein
MLANHRTKPAVALILAVLAGGIVSLAGLHQAAAATISTTKDEVPDLPVNQLAVAQSTITVAPGAGSVTAVTVTVAATHDRVGDLVVLLTHVATGTTVTMLDQPGTVGVDNGDNSNLLSSHPISFVDGAALPDAETLGSGAGMGNNAVVCRDNAVCTYESHQSLGAFSGLAASGDWRLSVTDTRAQDNGVLDAWSLRLDAEPTTTTTEPPTTTTTEPPTTTTTEPATTTTTTTTAPDAPTIIRNATAGDGFATVSWTAPASDGGSAITGYVVTPYIGYFPLVPQVFSSTATTQVVTGLTNGTQYRFRVQAVNAVGTSGYSTVTNLVTPSA